MPIGAHAAQLAAHFAQHGYCIVKCPRSPAAHVPRVARLGHEVWRFFSATRDTLRYRAWRFFNPVSVTEARHSIPLPPDSTLMPSLLSVLRDTLCDATVARLLAHMLPPTARLVELSSVISLPGALAQHAHADIPYRKDDFIVSGFVALADVHAASGPTHVLAGTHTAAFHHHVLTPDTRSQALASGYALDGTRDSENDEADAVAMNAAHGTSGAAHTSIKCAAAATVTPGSASGSAGDAADTVDADTPDSAHRRAALAAPIAALLGVGDILFFNTSVYHFGGANRSAAPRSLLSFSFQRPDVGHADADRRIAGFTYHMDDSAVGRWRLSDFQSSAPAASLEPSGPATSVL